MKDIANPNVPIHPDIIRIKHPANNEAFLLLPANNVQQAPPNKPRTFGVHHLTVLTACQILTSETGFLSLSRDRENEEGVVSTDPDGILTLKQYYYHLIKPQTDPLYPICLDFSLWRFPHNQLPKAWERTVSPDEDDIVANDDSWSAISTAVKVRDRRCRLSGWRDGISTAHIVPNEEGLWMPLNDMSVYSLSNKKEPENDSRNLFALRCDLHSLLFDHAKWVVVPKGGQMVVHFISQSYEAAALYHNQTFDTAQLSHEFLFARFAWAIIKQAQSAVKPILRERFRLIVPTSKSLVDEPQVESARGSVGTNRKEPIKKKRKVEDGAPLDVDDFQVNEAQELKEDFIFKVEEPDPRRDRYHTMTWYPGKSIMERRKREYMDTHPNIRARSVACPSLSSNNSNSEEEDC